jgi:predicted kinase
MAGEPGSGKSTLARELAQATHAVVLDKDYIKAPLVEAGLDDEQAGSLSYTVMFSVAKSLLEQGHSVVIDSPAFYPEIREDGQRVAEGAGVAYKMIECVVSDEQVQEARLRSRESLASQVNSVDEIEPDKPGHAPLREPRLILDTLNGDDALLRHAIAYLEHGSD